MSMINSIREFLIFLASPSSSPVKKTGLTPKFLLRFKFIKQSKISKSKEDKSFLMK
jgi:hypothetical protein